ncbi:hypothetical protein [Polaromonas sp.]|uniref:hypothetical protein n=1 Tax=Polaromonas sp. TaxID=1869339 RepID=UPI0013B71741|nr:hypothetical protein [Polaromonas sp.]NDP64186.1 hypothetical protein [Polaromonas sp.]
METTPDDVYKKSIKGLDALKMRTGGLDASARATLILINGSDSLAALQRKLRRDLAPAMKTLLAVGLVEPITVAALPPKHPAAPSAPPDKPLSLARHQPDGPSRHTLNPAFFATELIVVSTDASCARGIFDAEKSSAGQNACAPALEATPSASASPQPMTDPNAPPARRSALRREAIVRLAPYFGPDLMTVLDPLLKATTDADFLVAINALETKIALYQGRKSAAKLMDGLRP